jgi:hypothetical protein
MRSVSGTGFSREEASVNTLNVAVWHPTLSRLKPVPQKACGPSQCMQSHWLHAVIQWDRLQPGSGRCEHPQFGGVASGAFPAKAGPTKSMRSQSMHAVPLAACGQSVGPASAGKRPVDQPQFGGVASDAFPAKAGPTKSMRSQSMHAVPLAACGHSVGPASAGKRPV